MSIRLGRHGSAGYKYPCRCHNIRTHWLHFSLPSLTAHVLSKQDAFNPKHYHPLNERSHSNSDRSTRHRSFRLCLRRLHLQALLQFRVRSNRIRRSCHPLPLFLHSLTILHDRVSAGATPIPKIRRLQAGNVVPQKAAQTQVHQRSTRILEIVMRTGISARGVIPLHS